MQINVNVYFKLIFFIYILPQLLENIKHMQVEKYNKALTDEEKSQIECNPVTIFKQAVENCKPLLTTIKVVKSGVAYRVRKQPCT